MDWLVDLESTCSALGTADGKEYLRDEQCEEGVKDLIRFVSVSDSALTKIDSVSYGTALKIRISRRMLMFASLPAPAR